MNKKLLKSLVKKYGKSILESAVYNFVKGIENESDLHPNIFIQNYLSNCDFNKRQISDLPEKIDLELLQRIYYYLLNDEETKSKGITFTPYNITEYMINILSDYQDISSIKIIDPSCGVGAFLIEAINYVSNHTDINILDFVEQSLYGIDLVQNNVEMTILLINLKLYSLGFNCTVRTNIIKNDSLKISWKDAFNLSSNFDLIIGNPPYIKVQSMDSEYYDYLKLNYQTTRSGGFNIFYAFIEKSISELSSNGKISYILPNNFLKIKAASSLRLFLSKNKYLDTIIDFSHNILFEDVLTYNCILVLSNKKIDTFKYSYNEYEKDILNKLNLINFVELRLDSLNETGWIFNSTNYVDDTIKIAEKFDIKLGPYISTGIATLKDSVYILDGYCSDNDYFYKMIDNTVYLIEPGIVKNLYKVSTITDEANISDSKKYIIFPYVRVSDKYVVMEEEYLIKFFPKTFEYLLRMKEFLSERSSDNKTYWYAYGRSQGLNNFGVKLMYSQFMNKPRFIINNDVESLIVNGFSISDKIGIRLDVLKKILESKIMNDYILSNSYSINGGAFCYQKKYLQNFSIPTLDKEDIRKIIDQDGNLLDDFILQLYKKREL